MASHHEEYHCFASISRLSRLSVESSDGGEADAEMSDEEEYGSKIASSKNFPMFGDCFIDDGHAGFTTSLPGTPERAGLRTGPSEKEYASDAGAHARGRRRNAGWGRRVRERRLEHAWEMKKLNKDNDFCRVLVRSSSRSTMCMDVDEVKACRELGLELPGDWTVEIDTSSGGNSPIASHGDDPIDVKARLKVWAQAVALASASTSSLSG